MFKKCLILTFVAVSIIISAGCGVKNTFFRKEMPPLESYSTVVIASFDLAGDAKKYSGLPTMVSYGAGTKLSIRYKDKDWLFDRSEEMRPVCSKMKEMNICAKDICRDCEAAIKLAKAMDADLIIVGSIRDPKFTMQRSGKVEYDMSSVNVTGSDRYYSIYQTAMLKSDVKVVDVTTEMVIWEGKVYGYKKYKTRYRTGNPENYQREETMLADIRKDLVDNLVATLYPEER
jgi:hypothetical protein